MKTERQTDKNNTETHGNRETEIYRHRDKKRSWKQCIKCHKKGFFFKKVKK